MWFRQSAARNGHTGAAAGTSAAAASARASFAATARIMKDAAVCAVSFFVCLLFPACVMGLEEAVISILAAVVLVLLLAVAGMQRNFPRQARRAL